MLGRSVQTAESRDVEARLHHGDDPHRDSKIYGLAVEQEATAAARRHELLSGGSERGRIAARSRWGRESPSLHTRGEHERLPGASIATAWGVHGAMPRENCS